MSTEHVVVPVEPCEVVVPHFADAEECLRRGWRGDACGGCLGDGRRALLDQAVTVEERDESDPCCADGVYGPCDCTKGWKRTWVES